MTYRIQGRDKKGIFIGSGVFRTKMAAQKKVNFLKQMDDDLPFKHRDRSLKTLKVIKIKPIKRKRK